MLFEKLTVKNYGPFSVPTEIRFEPNVTVITGPNDSGKTSLLNLIERICCFQSQNSIREHEVNITRLGENSSWERDEEIACEVTFFGTKCSDIHIGGGLGNGDQIRVRMQLAPQVKKVTETRFRKEGQNDWSRSSGVSVKKFPTAIRLPSPDSIRTIIDLANPTVAEDRFLKAAFGPGCSIQDIAKVSGPQFANLLSKARGDMKAKLRELLPPAMHLEFDIQSFLGDPQRLVVHLRDQFSGHTSLEQRGAGVQRLVSAVGGLLSRDLTSECFVVLFDEPENSLHADAQHTLRSFLEGLGEKENVQVVYTTHSPAMLNTSRPESIRVLGQNEKGGKPTSEVVHRPIDKGYFAVRSSLGITPADSLLFAPITLIVEGATEAIGIPLILGRLHEAKMPGFEEVPTIQQQCHVVDGSGDAWEYLCRVAKSHGAKPIVFLDGDKQGSRLRAIMEKHNDVPVVVLDGRQEFEDLVPRDTYFKALQEATRELGSPDTDRISRDVFQEWEASAKLAEQMVFTKRVERWWHTNFESPFPDKPAVMKRALQDVNPADVSTNKLKVLVQKMLAILKPATANAQLFV